MKFLIDNALSPALAALLQQAGHDAVHVRSLGLQLVDALENGSIVTFEPARVRALASDSPTCGRRVGPRGSHFDRLLALRASL